MTHVFARLWLLTTFCAVGCAVGSGPDIAEGAGPGPVPQRAPLDNDGAVPSLDDAAGTKDAISAAPDAAPDAASDAGPDAAPDAGPVTCAFTGKLVSFDLSKLVAGQAGLAASTSAPGVTAGSLTRAGVTAVSASGAMNSSNWPTGAVDTGKHYVFSVTPPATCTMTVTALALDLKASNTGPAMAAVGTSVDSYAALSNLVVTPAGGSTNAPLAGVSGVSGALEVHVFGFNAGTSAGTLRIENTLSVIGSLAPL